MEYAIDLLNEDGGPSVGLSLFENKVPTDNVLIRHPVGLLQI